MWKLIRSVLLLQDNAPAHTSQVAMTAATECGFKILPYPPYFPDMTPSDFYLFLKTEIPSSWYTTWNNEGVIEAVNEYLGSGGGGGRKMPSIFEGIRKLESGWAKCIALKGDYIEK